MIFAVVITYKNPEKLATCLASLENQVYKTVIINNSPPAENLLYTAGINMGIREAMSYEECSAILVVCDDVILNPGAVTELSYHLASNPKWGIAMPIQVARNGDVTCGGCTKAFPVGWHITAPLATLQKEKPYESHWANGACFLLRADAVRECGLLDENMRFICSDSDYSFTLRARGWKIFVVPQATVQHEPDGAVNYKNPMIEKQKDADSLYFMRKWILGDLFRELSQEGHEITTQDIMNRAYVLQQRLAGDYEK